MNAPTPIKPSTGTDAFHRQRSRCIDAFATAEAAVVRLLYQFGEIGGTKPIAVKCAALGLVKASPTYTKQRKLAIDKLLTALEEFLPTRADMAHSRMQIIDLDGVKHARFVNSAATVLPFPPCRLLSFDQMRELTRRVEDIAGQLETA
ncbi:hypothetical protein [Novosphingobium colocasiae]|uniref:hypothetical protein n=1 Tax=Novosphingobium colocasiae TaxID=1256513 RepID=UPI0035B46E13